MDSSTNRISAGFTLIELMVVVGVIGILAALIAPAVATSREAMRRSSCSNNLRQIGVANQNYATVNNSFPSSIGFSAHARLLPLLEQVQLFNACNFSQLPHAEENQTLSRNSLSIMLCPSDPCSAVMSSACSYSYNVGYGWEGRPQNGPFGSITLGYSDVPDGTSTTAAVTECPVGSMDVRDPQRTAFQTTKFYLEPPEFDAFLADCISLDPATASASLIRGLFWFVGSPGNTLYDHSLMIGGRSCTNQTSTTPNVMSAGGSHVGGCLVLFLDGRVEFERQSTAADVWRALGSRNGGELLNGQ